MPSLPAALSEEEARRLMSLLLDGEISPQDADRLTAHLDKNPSEMDWMESQELVERAASGAPAPQVRSEETWAAVSAEISAQSAKAPNVISFPKLYRALSVAAAVALVGAFAWFSLDSGLPRNESYARIEFVDTDIPDASPIVYTDEESGWNVVWVTQFSSPTGETS